MNQYWRDHPLTKYYASGRATLEKKKQEETVSLQAPTWIRSEVASGLRIRAQYHADKGSIFIAKRLRELADHIEKGVRR